MEKFAIDLDKVLDEFELNEGSLNFYVFVILILCSK